MKPRFVVTVVLVGEFKSEQEAAEVDFNELALKAALKLQSGTDKFRKPQVTAYASSPGDFMNQLGRLASLAHTLADQGQVKE